MNERTQQKEWKVHWCWKSLPTFPPRSLNIEASKGAHFISPCVPVLRVPPSNDAEFHPLFAVMAIIFNLYVVLLSHRPPFHSVKMGLLHILKHGIYTIYNVLRIYTVNAAFRFGYLDDLPKLIAGEKPAMVGCTFHPGESLISPGRKSFKKKMAKNVKTRN